MSISIVSQPPQIHSSENDNWFVFQSNLINSPRFSMSMTVKDGSTIYNRFFVPTNPDNYNILNIKNIMSDFVLPDPNCFITAPTASTSIKKYNIEASESFEGYYIKLSTTGGAFTTASVINNNTLSALPPGFTNSFQSATQVLIGNIGFIGGVINSSVNNIFITGYGTGSNNFINSFSFSQSPTQSIGISASAGLTNVEGYLILESYPNFTTGATYSTTTKWASLAGIDYLEYNDNDNFSGYIQDPSFGGSLFLTNSPFPFNILDNRRMTIQQGEWATLGILQDPSIPVNLVSIVDNLGATYSKTIPSSLTQSVRIDIPTGPANLNISASASSYCITVKGNVITERYAEAEFQVVDVGGDWIISANQQITWGGYTFVIINDPNTWSDAEELFDNVIETSFNDPSNAAVSNDYYIVYTGDTSNCRFKIIAYLTGSDYDFPIGTTITSPGTVITTLLNSTSGSPIVVSATASETYCYDINCINSPTDSMRLTWINNLGANDYWTFRFVESNGVGIERNNFDKYINYGGTRESRGITTYKLNYNNEYTIVSDPLDDDTTFWLRQLFTSKDVWWIRGSELIPITITDGEYDWNTGWEANEVKVNFRLSRTNRK